MIGSRTWRVCDHVTWVTPPACSSSSVIRHARLRSSYRHVVFAYDPAANRPLISGLKERHEMSPRWPERDRRDTLVARDSKSLPGRAV